MLGALQSMQWQPTCHPTRRCLLSRPAHALPPRLQVVAQGVAADAVATDMLVAVANSSVDTGEGCLRGARFWLHAWVQASAARARTGGCFILPP